MSAKWCKACEGRGIQSIRGFYTNRMEDYKCQECNGMGHIEIQDEEVLTPHQVTNTSFSPTLNTLCTVCHEVSKSKGFYEEDDIPSRDRFIALVHGEVSEAHEADRKGDEANFKEELADIVIRVFDRCGYEDIDLQYEVFKKIEKNKKRPYKHGKKY